MPVLYKNYLSSYTIAYDRFQWKPVIVSKVNNNKNYDELQITKQKSGVKNSKKEKQKNRLIFHLLYTFI